MGIRYYAYAFDADQTEQAVADPESVISADPLADAWGMPPGFTSGVSDFTQSVPNSDMLYLDKAWHYLQRITASPGGNEAPRPAYRMFEGHVTMCNDGWIPWARAVRPAEVAIIANDLADLAKCVLATTNADEMDASEAEYEAAYLRRALECVTQLAATNRGFAYLIG